VGLLRSVGAAGAAIIAAAAFAACGEEERVDTGPAVSSARVAMTVTYPGFAPFALVTYRDRRGRHCHGLGTLTARGPRVLGLPGASLAEGLTRRGKCLGAGDHDVSLQVRSAGRGAPRLVGGIVRAGVTRVVVAGQAVRPRPGGEFLVAQPAGAGAIGDEIELEYRAGEHRRLPLKLLA
jgi:hypothetical protein